MKKHWMVGSAALAMAMGVSLAAQTQNPTSNTGPQGSITVTGCLQSGAAATGTSGTTTPGAATSGAATAGPTSSSGRDADMFTLTNARAQATSGESTSPGATAGTTTTVPNTSSNTSPGGAALSKDASNMPGMATYLLQGKTADLRDHIGQQVEVVGRFASNQSSSGSQSSGSSAAPATGTTGRPETGAPTAGAGQDASAAGRAAGSTGTSVNQPRIDVESVRMIAANCQR